MTEQPGSGERPFRLEEVTIEDLHAAIRAGRTNCVAVVRHYIERAQAYSGVASLLVTEDSAAIPQASGTVRAGAPLAFPTETDRLCEGRVHRLQRPRRQPRRPAGG